MKNFLSKNFLIFTIVALPLAFRFISLYYPAELVFDEVYFGKFANNYFTHQYYFDVHPPLGKLLIAGFAKISGFNPDFTLLNEIGIKFNVVYFLILRFLPALFGSLIPLFVYLLLKKMGGLTKTAFLGAYLVIFDNALLTQSKFILLDVMMVFFGFSSLYFFLMHRKEKNMQSIFLIISAILATFSLSIKWTGLSFLGIILLVFLIDLSKKFNLKKAFIKLSILILIPFIIYYLIFWIHFQILYKSGPGDAFMSLQFQKTLIGNKVEQNTFMLSNWQKFIELNKAMYYYNSSIETTHPYSSKWFQWPIDSKPVWYWNEKQDEKIANIYFFGNPVIWWSVLVGIIFSVCGAFIKKIRQKLPSVFWVLLLGYFLNILPYIFIGRVTFLYYYLPSLIFGILILSILYEKIFAPFFINMISKIKNNNFAVKSELFLYFGFLSLCLFIFSILSPLNYGFFIPSSSKLNELYSIFIKFLF